MKTVYVRIAEWTAWIPQHKSPQTPNLVLSNGVVGFEAQDFEKLLHVEVSPTGIHKHFPSEDDQGNAINQQYGLYAFQATLAAQSGDSDDLEVTEQPEMAEGEKTSKLVLPNEPNREQRRKQGKKK